MTWYNTAYLNKQQITISHTAVSGSSDLSSFAVPISITDTNLKTIANGGLSQDTSNHGYDIIFVDSTETTLLNWEMESYTATTGVIIAWVNISTFSHTTDTVIYCYFNNSSISTFQGNVANTWDSHSMLVAHMNDNATNTTVTDSTSHGYNLTNAANTSTKSTTDSFGPTLTYNGTSDYSHVAYNANFNTASWTVSARVKVSGGAGTFRAVASSRDASGSASKGWILYVNSSNQFSIWTGKNDGGGNWNILSNSSTVTNGTLYWVDATYDGTTAILYVNGSSVASAAQTYVANTTYELRVGAGQNESTANFFFNGTEGEFRFADTNRSAGWIATNYNLQSAPGTYLTVGSLQTNANNNAMSGTDSLVASDIGGLQSWNVDALTISDISGALIQWNVDALSTSDIGALQQWGVDGLTASDMGNIQTWSVDTLQISDTATYTDNITVVDALTITDSLLQNDSYTSTDSLVISDLFTATASFIASESNVVSDSLLSNGNASITESLAASDIGNLQSWLIDALNASDTFSASGSYLPTESLSIADTPIFADGYVIIEANSIADSGSLSSTAVVVVQVITLHVTWTTRNMNVNWKTRDMSATWRTRE